MKLIIAFYFFLIEIVKEVISTGLMKKTSMSNLYINPHLDNLITVSNVYSVIRIPSLYFMFDVFHMKLYCVY